MGILFSSTSHCPQPWLSESLQRSKLCRRVQPSWLGLHTQLPIYLVLRASIDGQRLDPPSKPFPNFIVPVLHQAGGRHHHSLVNFWLALWTLVQKCPHQCDALQRLAQAHLISHDAAVAARDASTGDTLPQELHSLGKNSTQPLWHPHGCCPRDGSLPGSAPRPYLIPPTPTYLSLMRPQDLTENRINDHMDREFFPEKTQQREHGVQTCARAHPQEVVSCQSRGQRGSYRRKDLLGLVIKQ